MDRTLRIRGHYKCKDCLRVCAVMSCDFCKRGQVVLICDCHHNELTVWPTSVVCRSVDVFVL